MSEFELQYEAKNKAVAAAREMVEALSKLDHLVDSDEYRGAYRNTVNRLRSKAKDFLIELETDLA